MRHGTRANHLATFNPFAAWGQAADAAWAVAPYPFSLLSRRQQFEQYYQWFQKGMEALGVPGFDIHGVAVEGKSVAVEQTVAIDTPFCKLLAFRRDPAFVGPDSPRVLLCAPLAGHRAVLLRDTVLALLQHTDVYLTDWMDARDVPVSAGRFGLDDFVLLLERFMRELGAARLDVIAVCQATVPALAAVSRLANAGEEEARTLTLIGGPVDARLSPTALNRMAVSMWLPWLDASAIGTVPAGYAGAGRRVYPGFLQYPSLVAAHPDRQFKLMADYLYRRPRCDAETARGIDRAVAEYGAVLDMPAEFFLDTLRVVFQQMLPARGTWSVAGQAVRPECLRRTALLTIEGQLDDISGAGQTHAAHGLCTGLPLARRRRVTVPGCDHYGLFSGDPWRNKVHPVVRGWMAATEPQA
ncbi:polyhydroxyalkanoate depolymerase [Cupriavidus respiraculi]|uniref:polyhydroxyalkanoate depolymerase n=1 Tax=Cupriavidus respiraculi TaxID=195930 RepID=UPI001C966585|nr:polyhydroxyalkanoate depolymerase [Cupriavidus respiraculi]MBY4945760.1 polyhydroxyalkanoate depolymerase [Cupriavidus respiraculi]